MRKCNYETYFNFLEHDIEYVRGRTVHIFLSQDFSSWQAVDEKEKADFEEEYVVENEFTIFDQSTFMLDTYDDYYKCEIFLKNQRMLFLVLFLFFYFSLIF